MLSKLTPLTIGAMAATYQGRSDRKLIQGLKINNSRQRGPRVMDGDCADGAYAVNRLKAGPENIPDVLEQMAADGTKYSDPWTGKDVLYEPGYPAASTETTWGSNYDNGAWTYERWTDVSGYEDAVLFTDGTASYTDPRQGGAGTCYWISSLSGAAEWPELITDMFLTGTDMTGPDAGIIGVQFYIRGKPWVVTIDDKLIW